MTPAFRDALIVDDHPLFCDALAMTLRAVAGAERVEAAHTLERALARLDRAPAPDLLVLDLDLPDVDGLDGLLRLRAAVADVPVMVVSSMADPRMIAATLAAGAAGFIPKHAGRESFRAAFEALAGGREMRIVLRERLERLTCAFPLSENYFAWQAFARQYAPGGKGPLPPYLKRENFAALQARAGNVDVLNASYTDHLREAPEASFDRYVLLDAQDWMTDAQLNDLWSEITRTARKGARVIFRTAAGPTLLPGRVSDAILARWDYRAEDSLAFTARDRSSIYGGFHLYVLKD